MKRITQPVRSALLAVLIVQLTLCLGAASLYAGDDENIALLARSAKGFAAVVKKAGPAVVHIKVEKSLQRAGQQGGNPADFFNDPLFQRFFGPGFRHPGRPGSRQQAPRQFKQKAAGSGFIISADGYILTNNHVVEQSDKITVLLADEREFEAKIVGTDPQSDVALIKIEGKNLPTLPLGNSDKLEVGEWVIAIGNPFELNQTVTVGVVSAKGRNRMGINDYENFIQTDAAINPGNSGGPLLNIHGEAIGINTAIFSRSGGYMGIGFAIPINMAKNIEQQLQDKGKVTRGWLGVMIQDINKDLAKSFELDSTQGVLISGVGENSPAAKADLRQGDVVVALNGRSLDNVAELRNAIALIAPDTKVTLSLMRDGKKKQVSVVIGEQPTDFSLTAQNTPQSSSPLDSLGLSLQNLTPALADQFGYQMNQGVLIAGVAPDSVAAQVGLQAGQLIEEVNKTRVHGVKDLEQVLEQSKRPQQVLLRVRSGDFSQYLVLRMK